MVSRLFTRQPNYPIGRNASLGITRGLIGAWLLGTHFQPRNLITNILGTTNSAYSLNVWAKGRCISTTATGNINLGTFSSITAANNPFSVVGWFYPTAAALGGIVAYRNSTSGWALAYEHSGATLSLYNSAAWLDSSQSITLNAWNFYAVSFDGSNLIISANGAPPYTTTTTTGVGTGYLGLNGWDNGASAPQIAKFGDLLLYNRALLFSEIKSLYSNLWQVYQPVKRKNITYNPVIGDNFFGQAWL